MCLLLTLLWLIMSFSPTILHSLNWYSPIQAEICGKVIVWVVRVDSFSYSHSDFATHLMLWKLISVLTLFLYNHLLQKKASSVNVAANLPLNIGHVRSVNMKEPKYEPKYVLQAGGSSSDTLSSALVTCKSYQNEIGGWKGEMITGGAELQSGPQLPLRPDDYITQAKVRNMTAQSYQGQIKQGFKPQEVKVRKLKLQLKK